MTDVPALVGGAMSDMLSFFQIGGASVTGVVAQSAVAAFLQRRMGEARDVLLEEFRQAHIDRIDFGSQDELGGVLFRYFNAIRDNAARLNLRLMAKVMAGQAQRHQLFADDFTKYANILASLARDEIIAASAIYSYTIKLDEQSHRDFSDPGEKELIGNLIPSIFNSTDHLIAVCTATTRTGLLVQSNDHNTFPFLSTPIMAEISQLADFQDALRKEGVINRNVTPARASGWAARG